MLKGRGVRFTIGFKPSMDDAATSNIKFPFLGSLDDGETFEYVLWSMHSDNIEIAILNWLVSRTKLHVDDQVDLYIPQILSEQYQFRKNVSGIITAIYPHEEMEGEIYRVAIDKLEGEYSTEEYATQLPVEGTPTDLLVQLVKDSMILKEGILVYLKHLIPYFSRIVSYSGKEYIRIKQHFLLDVKKHITANVEKLNELHKTLRSKLTGVDEIPIYIDLEHLREIFESEISMGLFQVVFAEDSRTLSPKDKNYGFLMYIHAIKNLEKRLYSNYNQIVLLYLKSLKFLTNQA